jgi:hypothetical protein
MPLMDEGLSKQFAGKRVEHPRLKSLGWVHQGGTKPRSFLPKRKGIWSAEFEPAFDSCHPIKLYVVLYLKKDSTVEKVETVVARILRNKHREEMRLPVRYPDDETAKKLIVEVLTNAAREELAAKRAVAYDTPVCVPSLIRLIGRPDTCPELQVLADRFGLRRSPTILGEGDSWTSVGSRLEFQTDERRRITTAFLSTIAEDRLCKDVPASAGQEAVRREFGAPVHSAEDGAWDRFDGNVALHVSYTPDRKRITGVTVMARHVAP